jgi:hypothetical protein
LERDMRTTPDDELLALRGTFVAKQARYPGQPISRVQDCPGR